MSTNTNIKPVLKRRKRRTRPDLEPQFHSFIAGNNQDQMLKNIQYEKELAKNKSAHLDAQTQISRDYEQNQKISHNQSLPIAEQEEDEINLQALEKQAKMFIVDSQKVLSKTDNAFCIKREKDDFEHIVTSFNFTPYVSLSLVTFMKTKKLESFIT